MRRRLPQLGIAASLMLAFVLALGGCGGDDGVTAEKPAEPARLTKQQLLKKMAEICEEHSERENVAVGKYDKKYKVPTGLDREEATDAELEREYRVVILPLIKDKIRDLEALRPSQEQEAKFQAFIRAMKRGVKFTEKDASFVSYSVRSEPFYHARERSVELGSVACGEP
jgi:hypothetical protein